MSSQLSGPALEAYEVRSLSHPLAALNHYHRQEWADWLRRYLNGHRFGSVDACVQFAWSQGLDRVIDRKTGSVIRVARQVLGRHFSLDPAILQSRQMEQFTEWLSGVMYLSDAERTESFALLRRPFFDLNPAQQIPQYTYASFDLSALAEARAFALSEPISALPTMSKMELLRARLCHRLGTHSPYLVMSGWSGDVCAGCHVRPSVL